MTSWPQSSTLIPELLAARPSARRVLDKYGLHGCGGPQGPVETLAFFARAHDVPLEGLLAELRTLDEAKPRSFQRTALLSAMPAEPIHSDDLAIADSIYRPFFKAGIVTILTLGAAWGAYLLLRIGLSGSFTTAGLHEINAHGHAQIFGWVGLFVMGFAYQAFPRFKHTTLVCPTLATMTLTAMVIGIVGRSVSQPLVESIPRLWSLAVASSALEVAAIVIFAGLIIATWRRSGKGLAYYDYYILCALGWFVVQAVYESVYLTATLSTGIELTRIVATWQAPLRDIQIHGFALLIILGVSQRIFHHFYALPQPRARLSLTVLPLLNLAVIGEALGLILMRTAGRAWAGLWYTSVILLAGCVAVLLKDWRIFSHAEDKDRSLKFLRAAYVWLFVSLAMLVFLPFHQYGLLGVLAPQSDAAITGFSHAYYGATRHAITVGFISLMIVGVAAKVVPTLNGVSSLVLSPLWGPFVLINAGCALRVVGQTATDFTAAAFPLAGVSGVLEVAGLAMWGAHLWLIMAGRARVRRPAKAISPSDSLENRPVRASDTPGRVLEQYPDLLPTFAAHGFSTLANPRLRATIGRVVTIGQACRRMSVNTDEFLAELNRRRDHAIDHRADLPLVSLDTLTATLPASGKELGVNEPHSTDGRHDFGPRGEGTRAQGSAYRRNKQP